MRTILTNGRIFDGDHILSGKAVVIDDGKIADIIDASEISDQKDITDLRGGLLAPGFVDVQVNGGGGVLLNDDSTVDGIRKMAAAHRRFGTTAMLPTMVSDTWSVMQAVGDAIRDAISAGIPGIRGVHFEGPYLNKARKGVHNEAVIRDVDPQALALLARKDMGVVLTTLAPEQVASSFIRNLADKGVLICAGHTAGSYDDAKRGLEAGITGFTHLFNAMSPMTSREPGVVGAALEDRNSWCGLIVDGYHVHDASLRVAIAAKPKGKMVLVTDAMPTVGATEKSFTLYGETIHAIDGRCATDSGTLAGSDLDMASAVRNTVHRLGLPLDEALRMASLYPAQWIGLDDRIGRLAPGYEADLVLLDDALAVTATWIGGREEEYS